jgi:NADH:ubiquinone reductase (H+-translocating)
MLHEVASGMIETRHIVTPIRAFCNRAKFYAAKVKSIDLKNRKVVIESPVSSSYITNTNTNGNTTATINKQPSDPLLLSKVNKEAQLDYLSYDYLVVAIGSETKFFGMADVQNMHLQ